MEIGKQNKVKFNSFDVIVIIIIALIITVVSYGYFLGSKEINSQVGDEEVEYTLKIEMVYEDFGNLVKVGDRVVDNATGKDIGKVVGVEISDFTQNLPTEDGTEQKVNTVDGYINILLTIESYGKSEGNTAITVNDCKIRLGSVVEAHTPRLTFTASCTQIHLQSPSNTSGEGDK